MILEFINKKFGISFFICVLLLCFSRNGYSGKGEEFKSLLEGTQKVLSIRERENLVLETVEEKFKTWKKANKGVKNIDSAKEKILRFDFYDLPEVIKQRLLKIQGFSLSSADADSCDSAIKNRTSIVVDMHQIVRNKVKIRKEYEFYNEKREKQKSITLNEILKNLSRLLVDEKGDKSLTVEFQIPQKEIKKKYSEYDSIKDILETCGIKVKTSESNIDGFLGSDKVIQYQSLTLYKHDDDRIKFNKCLEIAKDKERMEKEWKIWLKL